MVKIFNVYLLFDILFIYLFQSNIIYYEFRISDLKIKIMIIPIIMVEFGYI